MAALDWAAFLVVFLVAKDILSGQRERHWFLGAISLGGMTVAAAAVLQDYSSAGKIFWLFPSWYTEGVLGPFVNRNQYAAWVELLLPAALYLPPLGRRQVQRRRQQQLDPRRVLIAIDERPEHAFGVPAGKEPEDLARRGVVLEHRGGRHGHAAERDRAQEPVPLALPAQDVLGHQLSLIHISEPTR